MMEHDMSTAAEHRPPHRSVADGLEEEIDRLSLEQAIRDFEVANARVVDLTQRLLEAGRELAAARQQLEALRREHEELRSVHEQMHRSRAFKLANRIWAIRNAL